jgi:hypothetical protein
MSKKGGKRAKNTHQTLMKNGGFGPIFWGENHPRSNPKGSQFRTQIPKRTGVHKYKIRKSVALLYQKPISPQAEPRKNYFWTAPQAKK